MPSLRPGDAALAARLRRELQGDVLFEAQIWEVRTFLSPGLVDEAVLKLVPGLEVSHVQSSCCGMAGAFGYQAEHHDISLKMAEEALLPAVRAASADTIVVADGTSCRHQIKDGTAREAVHAAAVLHRAVESGAAGG